MIVWMGGLQGGEIVPENFAHVDVRDHGLLVGDSLFETVMTRGRHAQLLGRHVARLARSADAVGMACPDVDVIIGAVRSVLESMPDQSVELTGRLRITLSSGVGPMGLSRGDSPRLIVTWEEMARPTTAVSLVVSSVVRSVQPRLLGLKTGSWIENVLAMKEAREHGVDDALILNSRGEVVETSTANIFAVKSGTVVTPPLSSGCLAGVARQFLIENIPTSVRFAELPITLEELMAADEVFVTSALRGVTPVVRIADTEFTREPTITAMLQSVFDLALKESDD